MGTVGIYAILSSSNISNMLLQVNVHVHPRLLMLATTAFMCAPTLVTKSLGETLFVSIIGTATSFIVTIIVIAMACVYPIRNGSIHIGNTVVDVGQAVHFGAIPSGFAMSLSSASFAYIGTTIVPHIEGGMRRPESFAKVFGAAIALIAALYVIMATTGYWAYGSQTLSPITLNFPKSTALAILALSEALPFFDDVISLIGALTNPVLIYLTPIACYIKLKGWRNCSRPSLAGLSLLLAFGLVVSGFGLVETIDDIVKAFRDAR
ncbi:hypothetical protein GGH93_005123 [Coemansia aciculifera]|nr:hypothetical protein GGH93_005123 [Coemansia aciculifera]